MHKYLFYTFILCINLIDVKVDIIITKNDTILGKARDIEI
jgi:hypothetical protein